MKKHTLLAIFLLGYMGISQEEEKEKVKALETSNNYTWDANKNLSEDKFVDAEVDYRKAISKSSENATAPYNLGNAYYKKETYSEAFGRFKQAGEIATSKADKHKAYHNMGNVFMKRKEYEKAVEAYKEALRNNSKDEETRYNLALAKEMLKKEQDEQKKDENKDKKDQDKKDKKDKNEDKKDGDEGDKGDKDKKEEDKKEEGDKGDKGEEKKEDNKEGDGDEKKEEKKQPNQGDKPEKQQPRPNQLSKQQVQNLLEAMQNEEKKVKDKIDAKKVKGVKVKNEKDW